MSYKPLKKDLTDGTQTCHFCNRRLKSLKAYVLENIETKDVILSGPSCAEKNIDSKFELRLTPDLTRYTSVVDGSKDGSGGNIITSFNGSRLKPSEEEVAKRKAIEYLELREEKLTNSFNTSYETLKQYYESYKQHGSLSSNEIQHILNIENKAPESLRLKSLLKCYNYSFWMNVGIEKLGTDANKFLIPVRDYLRKKMQLSDKQKDGVNNWLKNLNGVPQLK